MAASCAGIEYSSNSTFGKLAESLSLACEQLKHSNGIGGTSPCLLEEFWTIILETTRMLSQEATKLSMLYSKPPLPSKKESESLVNSLEVASLAVLAAFHRLPISKGRCLHKAVRLTVLSILEGIVTLCQEVDSGLSAQLQSTGNVWEKCDQVKEIPKDNKEAVLATLSRNTEMVEDALSELQESMDNPNENFRDELVESLEQRNGISLHQPSLSEEEQLLLPPSRGLVQAAKAILRKSINALGRCQQPIEEADQGPLDSLADLSAQTSELVDDMVLATYPPLSKTQLRTHATNLSGHLKNILDTVKCAYFVTESDQTWIDFLTHAVNHNHQKLSDLLLT